MKRIMFGLIGLTMVVAMASCGEDATGPEDPTELEFGPETGVVLSEMTLNPSGLYWQDLEVGTGAEAMAGDSITVHYTLWLHDGTLAQSSVGGDPIKFSLADLLLGWQEGIPGMMEGGKRKLVIPPDLGYGASGQGSIPGNATIVFDIDLIGVG